MVKRSISSASATPEPQVTPPTSPHDPDSDSDSKPLNKKAKTTPKKTPKQGTDPTPKSNRDNVLPITPEIKAFMLEKAMELAYKALPFDEFSTQTGIPASRLKDQFEGNRSNLRKAAVEGLKNGGQKQQTNQ